MITNAICITSEVLISSSLNSHRFPIQGSPSNSSRDKINLINVFLFSSTETRLTTTSDEKLFPKTKCGISFSSFFRHHHTISSPLILNGFSPSPQWVASQNVRILEPLLKTAVSIVYTATTTLTRPQESVREKNDVMFCARASPDLSTKVFVQVH